MAAAHPDPILQRLSHPHPSEPAMTVSDLADVNECYMKQCGRYKPGTWLIVTPYGIFGAAATEAAARAYASTLKNVPYRVLPVDGPEGPEDVPDIQAEAERAYLDRFRHMYRPGTILVVNQTHVLDLFSTQEAADRIIPHLRVPHAVFTVGKDHPAPTMCD